MPQRSRSTLLAILALVAGLMALAFVIGGAWLLSLGGSAYYLVAGLVLLFVAWQLHRARTAVLWVYGAFFLATLAWAWWEVGLAWWGLAARTDVFFLFGLLLITPWVVRRLQPGGAALEPAPPSELRPGWRGARAALGLVLLLYTAVALMSWLVDPFALRGTLPAARDLSTPVNGVPPGEWHAYGRTGAGQRFSPLDRITPQNVDQLEVAWHFRTGDRRGQPGDPEETTFEVTPLKVGDSLFICTPHQQVIALDATSGRELWRFDPKQRSGLALQHQTCRGLSYWGGEAAPRPTAALGVAPAPAPAPTASAAAAVPSSAATVTPIAATDAASGQAVPLNPVATGAPDLPVAAQDNPARDSCTRMLYLPTADGRVIALDPASGAVCRNFGAGTGQINLWQGMPNVRLGGYYSTSPVAVSHKLLVVGGTVLDNVSTREPAGVVRGYDVQTGELLWNWDPARPDADTAPIAPGQTYTESSPNVWSVMSVDEELGLVYLPLGNPAADQWGGQRSPGVERTGSSVAALELATGRLRWVFQTVHHDLWDYDVPAQPTLVDLNINGTRRPALVQPTKQGEIYVLDRRTGKPIHPVTEQPVPQGAAAGDRTAPTQPVSALSFDPPRLTGASMWGATPFDQLACRIRFKSLRYEGRYTPPSEQGTLVYPGNFGVFNWGGIAVDPVRQIAFATPTYLAFTSQLVPRPDDKSLMVQGDERPHPDLPSLNENFGAPFAVKLAPFTSALGIPCQAPPWGYVAGIELTSGRVAWQHRNGTVRDLAPLPLPFEMGVPSLGGPLLTAGGVAFLSGTLDNYLRAYDVSDGRELWRSRLPAGGQATPMSYLGADGRQYVVVAAGGHGSLGTQAGDSLIAYVLPQR